MKKILMFALLITSVRINGTIKHSNYNANLNSTNALRKKTIYKLTS